MPKYKEPHEACIAIEDFLATHLVGKEIDCYYSPEEIILFTDGTSVSLSGIPNRDVTFHATDKVVKNIQVALLQTEYPYLAVNFYNADMKIIAISYMSLPGYSVVWFSNQEMKELFVTL